MDSLSFFQGMFATQGWNAGLLHCRQILYCLSQYKYQFISCFFPYWKQLSRLMWGREHEPVKTRQQNLGQPHSPGANETVGQRNTAMLPWLHQAAPCQRWSPRGQQDGLGLSSNTYTWTPFPTHRWSSQTCQGHTTGIQKVGASGAWLSCALRLWSKQAHPSPGASVASSAKRK